MEDGKYGMGRIGTLKSLLSLRIALFVKERLSLPSVRLVGDINKIINKVAITTGSGISYLKSAIMKKADLFITGDIKFHDAQEALKYGVSL